MRHFTRRDSRLIPCALLLLAALAAPTTAQAAFPGLNGKIAFARGGGGFSFTSQIYVMNADGTGDVNLTNDPQAFEANPAFSADGRRITFDKRVGSGFTAPSDIYVMNADGTGRTNLTKSSENETEPAFSPDGRRIAFTRGGDIWVMNDDGTAGTNLTGDVAGVAERPVFSPDGSRIAFDRRFFDTEGNLDSYIYVMKADGTGKTDLSKDATAQESQPAFSPDGGRIAFAKRITSDEEIFVMNADGSGKANLTNDPATDRRSDSAPAFSPDGRLIAWARTVPVEFFGFGSAIYAMNAGGTGKTDFGRPPGVDYQPDWQPIHVAARPTGPTTPSAPRRDTTAPVISGFAASPRAFRAPSRRRRTGTSFRYLLSEAADVRITIERKTRGRRVRGRCRRQTRSNRKRGRCTLYIRMGTLRQLGGRGSNKLRFSGRLRGRALRPGDYRASAVATDAAGNRSRRVRASFRVRR